MREKPWTTKELAEAAKVSMRYVRQEIEAGRLKAEKIGRDWQIPADVGEEWLKERKGRWGKF
jgi:excisionase family DNA binding protein